MTRRKFITTLNSALLSVLLVKSYKARRKLNKNTENLVLPNQELLLPENVDTGDYVRLLIPAKSVLKPSKIVYKATAIESTHEDFDLDTFGIFTLKYHGHLKGWKLT